MKIIMRCLLGLTLTLCLKTNVLAQSNDPIFPTNAIVQFNPEGQEIPSLTQRISNKTLVIDWGSIPGYAYIIEKSTDLGWTPVATQIGKRGKNFTRRQIRDTSESPAYRIVQAQVYRVGETNLVWYNIQPEVPLSVLHECTAKWS